jgi:dTDP-4-dehydrorhamnose reductase
VRVLITGGAGQLGRDLAAVLGQSAFALDRFECDVADPASDEAAVSRVKPDAIVNAAAYTDVDGCETDPGRARLVNAAGAGNVARAAGDALVVQISTDYVFDGHAGRAYVETDETNPLSVYGASKLEGEREVAAAGGRWAVVRTAWLYGEGTRNFVASILRAARTRDRLSVVDDQVGSPTSTPDLAAALMELVERGATGVLHGVNAGECSRFEFARSIFSAAGLDPSRVDPVPTEAMARPAARPPFAPMDGVAWRAAGLPVLRGWREALRDIIGGVIEALDTESRAQR